jgi:hypothetical protein
MARSRDWAKADFPHPTNKNAIIGGDATTNPWQRGDLFNGADGYTADRWECAKAGITSTLNVQKQNSRPDPAVSGIFTEYSFDVDTAVATPVGVDGVTIFRQVIEGYNAARFGFGQAGTRYVTLSFWHRHDVTGTYCAYLTNAANNRSYVKEYQHNASGGWEKTVLTFPVDNGGVWEYGNLRGLAVGLTMSCGSNYHTTPDAWQAGTFFATANQVDGHGGVGSSCMFALVQLEAGEVATQFESRDAGTELALCQRYYSKSYPRGTAPGTATDVGRFELYITNIANQGHFIRWKQAFPTTMRATPTVTGYSPTSGTSGNFRDGLAGADVTAIIAHISDNGAAMGGTGTTGAQVIILGHWTADAEL